MTNADFLTWNQAQVGNTAAAYQQACGLDAGDPWCAAYLSAGMEACGELGAIGGHKFTAASEWKGGSYSYEGYFKKNGMYHPVGSGYTPQPGDIICFGKGSAATHNMGSHVGVVEWVDPDGTVHTIEGNRRDKDGVKRVIRDSYKPGTEMYANISGFGCPEYQNPPQGGGNYSANGMMSSGMAGGTDYEGGHGLGIGVNEYEHHTVEPGDTLESLADRYHVSIDAILAYNEGLHRWDTLEPGTELLIPQISADRDNPWDEGSAMVPRAHTMTNKVYHPVIKVEFYAEGRGNALSAEYTPEVVYAERELDFDVISCTTQRSLSADCASMSITLTNRRDWYNILSSNDLVIVKMRRPEFDGDAAEYDEPEEEVFIGVIDDIRKSLDFSSGQPKRAVQVTARNMGKAFINFSVGLIKNITEDMGVGFMGQHGSDAPLLQMSQMNSAETIATVWDTFVGSVIRYEFYNGKRLEDYISYEGEGHEYEMLNDFVSYTQYSGSLWNFIKELSNAPFNETFWEVRNGKEVLVHRPCPFNPDKWKALKRTVIRDDDLVTDATGRSDLETYTVYIVNLRHMGENISQYYNPLWYRPFYEKYGITQLQVTSTYNVTSGDDVEAVRMYTEEIFNWNIKNNVFANGQIVVKGRNRYKIGETVVLEYSGVEFYVEGVSHNFTVYGGWTTTLSVTRGIIPSERFSPPYGNSEEMTPDTMAAILSMAGGETPDWESVGMGQEFHAGGGVSGGGGSFGGSSGGGGSFSISLTSAGGVINIPSDVEQCGCIPDDYTFYDREQHGLHWAYDQKKLYDIWKQKGKPSRGGLAMLDGMIIVAMADEVIGKPGDMVDIQFQNGVVIHAILGDVKGSDRQHPLGHYQNYYAPGGIHSEGYSLIEWEKTGSQAQVLQSLKDLNIYLQPVVKVHNKGSYFNRGSQAR